MFVPFRNQKVVGRGPKQGDWPFSKITSSFPLHGKAVKYLRAHGCWWSLAGTPLCRAVWQWAALTVRNRCAPQNQDSNHSGMEMEFQCQGCQRPQNASEGLGLLFSLIFAAPLYPQPSRGLGEAFQPGVQGPEHDLGGKCLYVPLSSSCLF